MLALAITSYFLIGLVFAVIFEIRCSKYYDELERFWWFFLWPVGLFSKVFGASIQFCIHAYYDRLAAEKGRQDRRSPSNPLK